MPKFGKRSLKNLSSCDKKLQGIFNEVIKTVDCSVLEGHRGKDRQNTFSHAKYLSPRDTVERQVQAQ